MPVTIREMKDGADFAICMAIRMEVFVREQGVPLDKEMDDHDAAATHYIVALDGTPVGTARTRVEGGIGKIERVAVRMEYRGRAIGAELMQHLIARLRNHPQVKTIALSAQMRALPFYQRLGFVVRGAPYDDAGIQHVAMEYAR